jgi:fumarate hydratase subunit beta
MAIRTHRMRFPLCADDARMLRAGDQVIIDGEIVITAGMPTHERLLGCLGGKGGLGRESAEAMQRVGAVYLSFLGGGCTLLSQAIKHVVEVGWSDRMARDRLPAILASLDDVRRRQALEHHPEQEIGNVDE